MRIPTIWGFVKLKDYIYSILLGTDVGLALQYLRPNVHAQVRVAAASITIFVTLWLASRSRETETSSPR